MSSYSFGAAFVLKGLPELNKLSKRKGDLIEGVFQVDIAGRAFHFIRKCAVVHSIGFGQLHDARADPVNTFCMTMLFTDQAPAEVHSQSEEERKAIDQIMQCVIKGQPVQADVLSRADHTVRRGWCKKQGKMMGSKRFLVLNKRGSLSVYKSEEASALPSYILLLHHRITCLPVKEKILHITGSFKALVLSFESMEERENWLADIKDCKIPPPKVEAPASVQSVEFQRHHSFMPEEQQKKYLKQIVPRGAAPAGPSGHW